MTDLDWPSIDVAADMAARVANAAARKAEQAAEMQAAVDACMDTNARYMADLGRTMRTNSNAA